MKPKLVVMEKLGEGSFSEVYKVRIGFFNRVAAIKVLRNGISKQVLVDEHEHLGKLAHSLFVKSYDVVRLGDDYALLMEFIEGADLSYLINPQLLPEVLPEVFIGEVVHNIACAMKHAREKGIFHRDIKPANIRVSSKGEVRIVDLGIAGSGMSKPNIHGSSRYLSPELLENRQVSMASELYALGVLALECSIRKPANDKINQAKEISGELGKLTRDLLLPDPSKRPGIDLVIARSKIFAQSNSLKKWAPGAIRRMRKVSHSGKLENLIFRIEKC